jgi:hypothetical protein
MKTDCLRLTNPQGMDSIIIGFFLTGSTHQTEGGLSRMNTDSFFVALISSGWLASVNG